jgi:hypothetical protein
MLHTIQRTLQSGWRFIRVAKLAADGASAPTDLTADGTLSPSLTDFTYRCLIPETANRIVIAKVANGDGKTGTCYTYLRRKDGDWELAFYATYTAGTQTTDTMYSGTTTGYFADTIATVTDVWGIQQIDEAAANRMSKVILDPKGSSEIAEYWTAMSATTSWASIMSEY